MVQRQIAFEKTKEQRDKESSLSEISPKWAKRLETPIPISITWLRWWFEIIRAQKCVVGEAHGFTSSYAYNCRECGKIGDQFSLYFMLRSSSKLEENKRRFVIHWNDNHKKISFRLSNLG
jgi:hypothetical protein